MFVDNQDHTCSYIESLLKSPYFRNIHDNVWIISVSDDTYCVMATEQNDEPTQINDVNIKNFAIIKLPCKSTLNCKHQISLRNANCQSSIDYYLASGGHYSKNDKLLELLNMDTFNDSMLLGFVNDANHINMISKNMSKIQRDQKDIQSFTINVSDYTQKGIELNDTLAIAATVTLIERTLKSRHNEICNRDTLTNVIKSSMKKLVQRRKEENNISGQMTLQLPVHSVEDDKETVRLKSKNPVKLIISKTGCVFDAIKGALTLDQPIATTKATDEIDLTVGVEQSNDKKKKKAGRKRVLKEDEIIVKIDISSFIERNESLKNEDYILQLIRFVMEIATDNNSTSTQHTIEKQIRSQLNKLRYTHKQNCKAGKKKKSLNWPTKVIAITLDIRQNEKKTPETFVFSIDMDDNKSLNNRHFSSFIHDDINCSGDIITEEEVFGTKSTVTILSEDDVQVAIDSSIVSYMINDSIKLANFIRTIKSRLVNLGVAQGRINWTAIRRSLIRRVSTIVSTEELKAGEILNLTFKLIPLTETMNLSNRQTRLTTNPNRKLKFDEYDLQEFMIDTETTIMKDEKLMENHYFRRFLLWKLKNYVSDSAFTELNNLEDKYNVKCPNFSKIRQLRQTYIKWLPLKTTTWGSYMHVKHAIVLLTNINPEILNNLKDKRTLHFRLCQDGTWFGRRLNCIVSALGWVDAGEHYQNPFNLVPLSFVRVVKENRDNIEQALTPDFIKMFKPGQVIELRGVEYNIVFSYSADFKMVSQIMGLSGPCSYHFCNWCKITKIKLSSKKYEI
ncbi:unnamed protein product [Didymodactylos carnosus]|uniref:Uncharacterized protein n=1 Tax=Didymodactylos carnosus TaxID=1234261 RepID=A0A8S2PSS8_9BILA|nr:unnamed protein product [Didymodactylos carnosus]CAF4068404.1 unnamed protein product [Didymodactylos carnosus]